MSDEPTMSDEPIGWLQQAGLFKLPRDARPA
jgi:hypothetical protein